MIAGVSAPAQSISALRLYTLVTLMTVLWSLNFVISKLAVREIPPLLAACLRTLLAGLIMALVYRAGRGSAKASWTRKDVPLLLALGALGVVLNQLCFVLGISRTSVAHAGILIALSPMMVLLIAAATGQERWRPRRLVGMMTALSGVAMLHFARGKGGHSTLLGDVFILLSGLLFAMFSVLGKSASRRFDPLTVNLFGYSFGGLLFVPLAVALGWNFDFAQVSLTAWLSLVYMAAFSSVFCYLIYYYALSHAPASRVSAFSYLQPLLATLFAIPVLGERPTVELAVGGALVVAGVYMTERL